MAANKTNQALKLLEALARARYSMLKTENNILMSDMGSFIKDNRELVCREELNMTMVEFNPYASMYLKAALREVDIPGVELFRHSDGASVIAVPKECEDKIEELKIQVDKLAKEFCTDRKTFEGHMKANDEILTIPQDTLTESQMFMFMNELTNAGAFYYLDVDKQTISYLSSQEKEVKRAVNMCAAEMSSKDANYYTHYFGKERELFDKIEALGEELNEGECRYLVSEDRLFDKGIYALKIEEGSYREVFKDTDGMIREGKAKPIDFGKDNDITLLCMQTLKYNKPLLISQDEFEDLSVDKLTPRIQTASFKTYGELTRDRNDQLVINFLRNAGKNGINIETYKKDISEIYDGIKDQCLTSGDAKKIAAWETIADVPQEEVQETIAAYKNVSYALKTAVIDKAEIETEKVVNKDRE